MCADVNSLFSFYEQTFPKMRINIFCKRNSKHERRNWINAKYYLKKKIQTTSEEWSELHAFLIDHDYKTAVKAVFEFSKSVPFLEKK